MSWRQRSGQRDWIEQITAKLFHILLREALEELHSKGLRTEWHLLKRQDTPSTWLKQWILVGQGPTKMA
jgi:hypothetical protein